MAVFCSLTDRLKERISCLLDTQRKQRTILNRSFSLNASDEYTDKHLYYRVPSLKGRQIIWVVTSFFL